MEGIEHITELQSRLGKIEGEIGVIKTNLKNSDDWMERLIDTMDKTSEAMQSMQVTMVQLSTKIDDNSQGLTRLENKLNENIMTVDSKIDALEDSHNINWVKWVKTNFVGLVGSLFLIYYIVSNSGLL